MYRNSFFKQILLGLFVAFFFASCDKDFNEIGTNIIGDDHFGFDSYTDGSIKAFNQKLEELQKSQLPALEVNNLSEIVLYQKLLDIQNLLDKLSDKITKL